MPNSGKGRIADSNRLSAVFWLLCLYYFFEYVRPHGIFTGLAPLRIPLLLTAALALCWLLWGNKRALKDPLVIMFGLFIALCAGSILWAVNHYWVAQISQFLTAFMLAGVLPAAGFLNNRRILSAFFVFWVFIHFLVALYSISNGGRGTGSFLVDENDMALAINMAIPYAYFLLQSSNRGAKFKAFMVVALLTMIGAVIISESRGGFLGLMVVTVGILFFTKHRIRNALIIAFFGLVAFLNLPSGYVDEMQTITDQQDSTRNERLHSWKLGWHMFLDYPIAGIGAGNYAWRVGEFEDRYGDYTGRRSLGGRVSHSLYFTLIPELGLIGTLLFGAMTLAMYRRLRGVLRAEDEEAKSRSHPKERGQVSEAGLLARAMLVSMLGLFASGAFISVLYYPHFWYLIGFVLALQYATQDRRATDQVTAGRALRGQRRTVEVIRPSG